MCLTASDSMDPLLEEVAGFWKGFWCYASRYGNRNVEALVLSAVAA